ncbi:MAG: cation diffusion facilitator family transporter [Anaerolineales bacterium]|nr:cation diffusion facilitator family transporter [Anaerolineales bacterium]
MPPSPVVPANALQARAQSVQRVLWIVLLLNVVVTLVKLAVGLWSGALAIVADAFHSLVDSSSNIIGLAGVWISARPADRNHPYGHQKYETIAAMAIGAMLMVAGYEIGKGVLERLSGVPAELNITPLTFALMAFTFGLNLGVVWFETRAGRRLNSQILLADASHTRVDLLVTLSVMASLIGTQLGWGWLDPLVAGGVVVLLFRAAFEILRHTSDVLTDVAVADPAEVERIARAVPGVATVRTVRSRGREGAIFVDLNLQVDPVMDTAQAHNVASEVEQRLAQALPGVVETLVHVEPRVEASTPWEQIAHTMRALADGLGLGLHDLHGHAERDGGYSLEMHLEVDAALTLGEAHARVDEFERRARAALPQTQGVVTHIEPLPAELPDEVGRIAREAELRRRITRQADRLAGAGACHEVRLHNVGGHVTATLHVTQPADLPLTAAHELAERIERALHGHEPDLHRVVVHVEPPEPAAPAELAAAPQPPAVTGA